MTVHIKDIVYNLLESMCIVHIPGKRTFYVPNTSKVYNHSSIQNNEQVNTLTGNLENVHTNNVHSLDITWNTKRVYTKAVILGRLEELTDEDKRSLSLKDLSITKAAQIKRVWCRGLTNEQISQSMGKGYSRPTVAKYTPIFNRGRG